MQEWASRYDAFSLSESGRAITVDAFGNVYVTGVSGDPSTGGTPSQDYATVKYNPAGAQQWAKRYNGPGNSADAANAIAVDALGNVIVTGTSVSFGTNWDYYTIKYNSIGDTLWRRRYDSPISAVDNPVAVVVDSLNNIYITGSSREGFSPTNQWATIKYSASGALLWLKHNNFCGGSDNNPYAMVLNGGFIFITGATTNIAGDLDFLTIKQDALTGDTIWTRTFNGTSGGNDVANDIFADSSGNIYVTGKSQYSGTSSTTDYLTIKYDSFGTQLWTRVYDGTPTGDDAAVSVAVNDSGYVFVTGYSQGASFDYDYATVKYNAVGTQQWVKRYNGTVSADDKASDLILDKKGNVYVTGYSKGTGTYTQYTTISYNNAGGQKWIMHYNGPVTAGIDEASAIAIDDSANVYVTGKSEGTGTATDYLTIKYSQTTVGINSPEGISFSQGIYLFPNPIKTTLTIISRQGNIKEIEIYNALGQKQHPSILQSIDVDGFNLDVSGLNSGIYFVRVSNGENTNTQKFIIQ